MPSIALPTFLNIMTKGTPQKVSLYSRYLTPGGYNYYRHLQDGAHEFTVGRTTFAEVCKTIKDGCDGHEQKYNLAGIDNLRKWLTKQKPSAFFEAPTSLVSSPEKFLSVKLEPEFGAVIDGQRYLLQVYYSAETKLTKTAASLGTRMIEHNLCKGEFQDCKPGILDLRKKEIFTGDYNDQAMDMILALELGWADTFFKAQKAKIAKIA